MSDINEEIFVPEYLSGQRFDKIAAELFSDFSRAELTRWINSGDLLADDRVLKPKTKLYGGETLQLTAMRERREAWQEAQAMDLDILFEDEHLIVLNKPPGLVVHPGAGNYDGTLVNGLLAHRGSLTTLPRAGVVHRLDKDTSGVMVIAASTKAHTLLTQMIQDREIERRYQGICEGRMVAGCDVDKPIGRHPSIRTKQAVRDDGKPAFTQFRVAERFRVHTLVNAQLGTGRTHQIRVHLQSIVYPLLGDKRYGARGKLPSGASQSLITTLQSFARHALHAKTLEFTHPISQQPLKFEAPLPVDMLAVLEALREDAS